MADVTLCQKIKDDLRIKTSTLDADIAANIEAAAADLHLSGVDSALLGDPLILRAVKLYCRAALTLDPDEAAKWQTAYDALKGSLMISGGYRRE